MTESDGQTPRLLEEIRDLQREQLAEYRRVTQQSLELQQRAVDRQQQLGRLYSRVVGISAGPALVHLALLAYLLARWANRLF
jgi:hypothetical protein